MIQVIRPFRYFKMYLIFIGRSFIETALQDECGALLSKIISFKST